MIAKKPIILSITVLFAAFFMLLGGSFFSYEAKGEQWVTHDIKETPAEAASNEPTYEVLSSGGSDLLTHIIPTASLCGYRWIFVSDMDSTLKAYIRLSLFLLYCCLRIADC